MFRFCMFCVFLCCSCVYGAAIPKNDDPPPVEDSKPNAVPNINIQPLPNADAKVVPNRNVQPLPNADAKDIPNRNVQPLPNEDAKDVPNRNDIPLPNEDANVVPNRNDAPLAIEDAHILNRKEAPVADMVPNRNDSPLKNEDLHIQHMDVERPPLRAPSLKTSDLQPPDHLDAVRMEQDGHLNRDFKKEVFAGNHEEYEEFNREHAKKKLEEIFLKYVCLLWPCL
ncbi:hypothetical protein NP493_312g02036 [Ridgeia piscesae]|uniref:Uncharacterized protein n=1 Tax=Ridgeia piscesae TaxID=27915 RepID=A0AAD9L5V6_RIDPI|nr:hypothetical protein NP493_312g02036 [Ridgeia piscesae]